MATLGDILRSKTTPVAPVATPFASTPVGVAVNTITGLPSAAVDVGKKLFGFGTDVARSLTRAAGSIPGSINADINQLFSTKLKTTADVPDAVQHPILNKAFTTAFGSEPIPDIQDQVAKAEQGIISSKFAQSIGADKHALPLAFAGVLGGKALDLTPFGGAEKGLADQLAKETTDAGVRDLLTKAKVAPEAIDKFVQPFIDAKTPKEAQQILDVLKGTLGTHATGEAATQVAKDTAQNADAIATIDAKIKTLENDRGGFDSGVKLAELDKEKTQLIADSGVIKSEAKTMAENVGKTEAERASSLINLDRLRVSDVGAAKILNTIEDIRPALEEVKGAPVTHDEVLKAAQQATLLTKATSREATLKSEAALLATRQNLASMAEGKGVSQDFIDQLRVVSAEATRRGRELNALGIGADPIAKTTKGELVKQLLDAGVEADKLIKASEGVDFNNLKEVTQFYRTFVKPTKQEWLDEFRYINLLSSPKTHIVNAFSNLIQGTVLNPATRLATGAIDAVLSTLSGRERSIYAKEVSPYYRGFFNAVPDAAKSFFEAMKGNIRIDRPDMVHIPTGSKLLRPFQAVPRLLEASDVFFRTLITQGEKQAIAARYVKQGKALTDTALAGIEKEAQTKANYYVFRKALDGANKSGQGHVLSAIDKATTAVYSLRKVPGVKWFIPFVQTPMNILKQGIEYSPLGLSTLPGATNKTEQLAKTMIGSTVFLGAAGLASQGRVTWAAPTNQKEKDAFYNSGRQPYSIKLGNNWVSFSKLGPLAYPLAMAAAFQWYEHDNPKNVSESTIEKSLDTLQGIAQFFSDQSYMQGMKSLIDFSSGDSRLTGIQSVVSSNAEQLVPLSSLQRWVTQVVDPVYRKPDTKFSLKNLLQSIEKDIPGLSQNVPRIPNSTERQNPLLNALSPLQVTNQNTRYDTQLKTIRSQQRIDARLKAIKDKALGN